MKKQFLLLAFFTLAILAGTNKVFGQALDASTTPAPIVPLICIATSEPLHPFAGVPYKYILDGANGPEVAKSYTWWATKDMNFISGEVAMPAGTNTNLADSLSFTTDALVATSSNYGKTTLATTAGANEVEITWSADILAGTSYQGLVPPGTPTFVVGYAEGENCADNIQVFEIAPLVNFTIDIAAIDTATGSTLAWDDASFKQCVDAVQSATYNTTSKELDMDYGHNVVYFEVAASNFVKNWTPTFEITDGLATTQTAVISLHASYADAQGNANAIWTSNAMTAAGVVTGATAIPALSANDIADVATGVSVFVRVYIDNNTEESLADSPFTLAVDAIDNDAAGIWDMEDDDCGVDPTTIDEDRVDEATITITPRPTLNDATTPETMPNPDAPIIKTN